MYTYKAYVPNPDEWKDICEKELFSNEEPGCQILEEGYILPVIPDGNINVQTGFKGGVCNENGDFIKGMTRFYDKNGKPALAAFSVTDAYDFDARQASYLDYECVYGGIIVPWFGHLISDSMPFLWYVVKNPDCFDKVLFLSAGNCEPPATFWDLMELLGLSKEKIVVVDKIYKVRKLHVPDQSFLHHGAYTREMLTVYDKISETANKRYKGKKPKKIYLTRNQQNPKTGFNEEYFEKFYKKRGYTIIAPETLPLYQQIAIYANVEEIVCIFGSLTEMIAFAPNCKKITTLLRVNSVGDIIPSLRYIKAREMESVWVDVSRHLLPTTLANGRYYVGPTPYWRTFLEDSKISFKEKEMKMNWSYLYEYMVEYATAYSNSKSLTFIRVKDMDIFDLIDRMNFVLNERSLNRKHMNVKSKKEYENEIKSLQDKLESNNM